MISRRGPAVLTGRAAELLRHARFEVIPTVSVEDRVLAALPPGTGVTVTASPAKGLEPTLGLAVRLAGHGYRVVPHLAARMLRDKAQLADVVARLREAGIDAVFVPAGDADPPAGAWDAALPALVALRELGDPFAEVGVTGYPESHPVIDDDVTVQAMWDKRSHATTVVSNLCFDPAVIAGWVRRVRRRGVRLPILVGIAGPADPVKLLATATKVGVGESTRFLTQHSGWFARLASPGYSPERLLARVTARVGGPEYGLAGLHVFTFNNVADARAWQLALLGEQPVVG